MGAMYIRAVARGISGRFMITVCIWVGQSVFRPAARNPGSLVRTCTLPSPCLENGEGGGKALSRNPARWAVRETSRAGDSGWIRVPVASPGPSPSSEFDRRPRTGISPAGLHLVSPPLSLRDHFAMRSCLRII